MRRISAALLVAAAALSGCADESRFRSSLCDLEGCRNAETLAQTEPALAVAACRPLADNGMAFAQSNLGTLYYRGQGVPQDYSEAASMP
jgi:TPR repeat protein